ncbi:MAG: 6-phosphofructokinase, partial [Chitinophagales bacterium]
MGRDAGFIALRCGVAGGAEAILIPETKTDIPKLIKTLDHGWRRKKSSSIVIVSEGDEFGGADEVAKAVEAEIPNRYDIRKTILGHIQRGGSPTCIDRVRASKMGFFAVEALLEGKSNVMTGIRHKKIILVPLSEAVKSNVDKTRNELIRIAEILSY